MSDIAINFNKVERLAVGSKFRRLAHEPFKYVFAFVVRKVYYPLKRKGVLRKAKLFFGKEISVLLPAGADIYLTGGKTHDSEIRLTKFIMKNLEKNDAFIDVGAHFGYFSLLASSLVGPDGRVFAIEPSVSSYKILNMNVSYSENIVSFNAAASDNSDYLTFYEFPAKYSEYNSFNIDQFRNTSWFDKNKPEPHIVKCITLDEIIFKNQIRPRIIKIDVEGAEFKVISGLSKYLETHNKHTGRQTYIVMEYLAANRSNEEHIKARNFLESKGYSCHVMNDQGMLCKLDNVDEYLKLHHLDSDNIVFKME